MMTLWSVICNASLTSEESKVQSGDMFRVTHLRSARVKTAVNQELLYVLYPENKVPLLSLLLFSVCNEEEFANYFI